MTDLETVLYTGNRIEQIFRDGMAVAQHANISSMHFDVSGRVLLGLPPAFPLF